MSNIVKPKISKTRAFLTNMTVSLVTIIIMTLVMEGILQIVIRVRDGEWLYRQLEGSRVPHVKIVKDRRKFTLLPGYNVNKEGLKIDEWGFRAGPAPIGKDSMIVVTAGDSVPFGVAVKNKNTYPFFLAKLFHKNGYSVDVLNSGVPSYNLRQSFDRLRIEVIPRFGLNRIPVITMQAANDIFLLSYYREKWTPDITWADRRFIKKTSWWQNFAIVYYGDIAIKKIFKSKAKKIRRARKQEYNTPEEGSRKKYDRFECGEMLQNARRVLEEELAYYRDHSVNVILMPVDPFYYQLSGLEKNQTLKKWLALQDVADAINEMVTQYNDMLIEVSKRFDNVFFFDTRVLMDANDRGAMYADHIHYSPEGNRIIAQGLYDFILRHHLLPEKASN